MSVEEKSSELFSLPYEEIIPELLGAIWEVLSEYCSNGFPEPLDVNRSFSLKAVTGGERGYYAHLLTSRESECSLRTADGSPQIRSTRISDLIAVALRMTEDQELETKGVFLPSPLKLLVDYLTIPEEVASRAYAFMVLRLVLFEEMRLWPEGPDVPEGFNSFSQKEVVQELQVISTYWNGRDNIPIGGSPVKTLICHLLAMFGLMDLRFGTEGKTPVNAREARRLYCNSKCLAPKVGYEFRVSDRVRRLPEASEIINRLWGISLPIRGADTLFFGGLRFSSNGGLVAAISGGPGTGKTSFALGLAAVLAPLGATTFYITAEESCPDLRSRLSMVTPDYLRKIVPKEQALSIPSELKCKRVSPESEEERKPDEVLGGVLDEIKVVLSKARNSNEKKGLPLPCPLIVVIDGLQVYLGQGDGSRQKTYPLLKFIRDCRDLNALVVLTSGVQLSTLPMLEYLVDVVIRLDYRDTETLEEKPLRILELIKTRHQISRPGTHVFHISGADGIKVSPQLPSQLDTKAIYEVLMPDGACKSDVMNRYFPVSMLKAIDHEARRYPRKKPLKMKVPFLQIFPRSHILVHGKGSAGKSGFGLKLLMAPFFKDGKFVETGCPGHRILIISFLYPAAYYVEIWRRLASLRSLEYRNEKVPSINRRDYEVLHFFPGYLNPEDMASKIMRKLDSAELEGAPYTGVMFDGIHNVFLQFPRLESREMVWPMIFDLLRRRELTVVTTHTNITVHESDDPNEDYDLNIRKAKPLLHAILQGADFFLGLNEETPSNDTEQSDNTEQAEDDLEARYMIWAHMAQGQPKPQRKIYWHREKLAIYSADG